MRNWNALWALLLACASAVEGAPDPTLEALWLFDESTGSYPSTILVDASPHGRILALGRGGCIVEGKYGQALAPCPPRPLDLTGVAVRNVLFGLAPAPTPPGRGTPPLDWSRATFVALATVGEKHLRQPGFANVTQTKLNLGAFDWTVEFWFRANGASASEGVVFELGRGPRGDNDAVTRLTLNAGRSAFRLENQPSQMRLVIPTNKQALDQAEWRHLAFVYAAAERQLRHYVDGVMQPLPEKAALVALPVGEEAYMTVGCDGVFKRPLSGRIDELRIMSRALYREGFQPPGSFSRRRKPEKLLAGPPLLFESLEPLPLGSRKHLFLDNALIAEQKGIRFVPNPPRRMEKVLEDGARGHLAMAEDEQGVLRLYYRGPQDSLAVMTSRDGIHWEKPDLGRTVFGERNIVLEEPVGLGIVFIDPNAPPNEKWKYFSGIRRQPMYVFSSPDGWRFERNEVAALPFAAGSQSVVYYDDQRQLYVGHHRSDYALTPGGHTLRRFVRSETRDLMGPWLWEVITPEKTKQAAKRLRIHGRLDPWYLDNGPLAPSGIGLELPTVMAPDENLDPVGTDIYVTKAMKYPWATDAYLAFPSVYFHYEDDGPQARRVLGEQSRQRGSGVNEVQLAVSRDGLNWKRYPRPAYVPIGGDGSNSVHQLFLAYGMFRRGNEIWQYVGGHGGQGIGYHSAWKKGAPSPLWRLVQRMDGFVAAEGDYRGGLMVTKAFTFEGNRLVLNIDTGAVGYAQVGILDLHGNPLPGYTLDECVYINGDFLEAPVEWLGKGTDVGELAGRPVRLAFRLRGAKLFAMQFVRR